MALRNRVHPDGRILALDARGTLTGNRGILHVADGVMGDALWRLRAWITCTLDWQGRRRAVMSGRKWTELFFLDEATSLAAGHRPCAYCRRPAFVAWRNAWADAHGPSRAPAMDAALHAARAHPGARAMRRWITDDARALPDGTMIATEDGPALRAGDALRPWTPTGYGAPRPLPTGRVEVLTPAPTVEVLRAGYAPAPHPSLSPASAPS